MCCTRFKSGRTIRRKRLSADIFSQLFCQIRLENFCNCGKLGDSIAAHNQKPIDYIVESVRDGRSMCTRLVRGVQEGKTVFLAICNFGKVCFFSLLCRLQFYILQLERASIMHSTPRPSTPSPEQTRNLNEVAEQLNADVQSGKLKVSPNTQELIDRTLEEKEHIVLEVEALIYAQNSVEFLICLDSAF